MIDKAWKELGGLDILVNNAGIETIVGFLELTDEQWTRLVDVNLRGAWLCSQVFCRRAIARKAERQHRPHRIDSGRQGASRAYALCTDETRTRGADTEHVGRGHTPGHSSQLRASGSDRHRHDGVGHEEPDILPLVLQQISLGRAGEPREIGTVVAFMASDEASYLTGQSIHVDGGWQGK